jgi:wyosine [tRNA(Phe)-imidazoG37] synthetase (radical SAM superfamily)
MGANDVPGLGNVLRVDFNPLKVCSFSCVYCGVGPTTRKTFEREAFYPVEDVFGEVRDYIEENGAPDYVMLTGNGEPTLYSGFGELAQAIKRAFPGVKLTLYTNGSLFYLQEVRDEVALCDLVMINLNSVEERAFRRICRPHKEATLERVVSGIEQFRQAYTGPLWMDVVFVKGVNDSEEGLEGLMRTVLDIRPDLYRVRTMRAPVGSVAEPVSSEFKEILQGRWKDLPLEIVYAF